MELIRFSIVVDNQALIVLGALVHHLAEPFERREHAGVVLPDSPAVRYVRLAENENIVNVRAQIGRDAQRVLHRDDEHDHNHA